MTRNSRTQYKYKYTGPSMWLFKINHICEFKQQPTYIERHQVMMIRQKIDTHPSKILKNEDPRNGTKSGRKNTIDNRKLITK